MIQVRNLYITAISSKSFTPKYARCPHVTKYAYLLPLESLLACLSDYKFLFYYDLPFFSFLLPLKTYKRAIFLRKFEFNLVILSSAMIEVFHILPLTSWSPLFFAFLVSVVRYSAQEVPPFNFWEYRHDHKVFNLESNLPNEEGSLTYYSSILIMHILLYHLP